MLDNINGVEIEISTFCSWKCPFCPYSIDPKPRATMSMEHFNLILDKAIAHKTVGTISLNQYNEPTLDKHFDERLTSLKERGLHLLLHTNASGLTEARLKRMRDDDIVQHITFNLPSLDPSEFKRLTGGARNFDHVVATIDLTRKLGVSCDIRVNGTLKEMHANYEPIIARWPGIIHGFTVTNDRSGVLTNKYAMNIKLDEPRLMGCEVPDRWLYVSVHGDVFLCCEDYYQRTIYGSLLTQSISEVRNSDRFRSLYNQINGIEEAAPDLLCRSCFVMFCSKQKALAGEGKPSE